MKMMNYIKTVIGVVIILLSAEISAQRLLTKKEAIQITLENNYGIKLAENNVEIAKNNSSIYNSGFLPSLSANGGANYDNSNQEIDRQDGTTTVVNGAETKSYNASLDLNYTIFDGLGRKYDYKLLQETSNLTELQARETIENTYLQLFTVYFQIARLSKNTDNLKETLEISKLRLERIQYQNDYGQSTKLELLNAEVDVNNDSINYINTRQEFINAKRDLNIILGVQLNEDYTVETEVDFLTLLSFNELLSISLENNVVLMQQEKNITISEYNINANKSSYLPRVGLTGSYGWNESDNPSTSFFAGSTVTGFRAGLNVSWNVFDGGSTKTRVANAKIALDSQEILQTQQFETLENVLKNTSEEYTNNLFILKAQEQNVITNQNNFDRSEEKYKLGQINSIDFRLAQVNLLNSQTDLTNTKYETKLIELRLLQLSGQILNVEF
ncbi:MAG: TolC family protein [Urechidicola sp.]|nr:TolC family protein [Urechidicola sp.]